VAVVQLFMLNYIPI